MILFLSFFWIIDAGSSTWKKKKVDSYRLCSTSKSRYLDPVPTGYAGIGPLYDCDTDEQVAVKALFCKDNPYRAHSGEMETAMFCQTTVTFASSSFTYVSIITGAYPVGAVAGVTPPAIILRAFEAWVSGYGKYGVKDLSKLIDEVEHYEEKDVDSDGCSEEEPCWSHMLEVIYNKPYYAPEYL